MANWPLEQAQARPAGCHRLVLARRTSPACCRGIDFSRLPQTVDRSQPPSELAPRPCRSTSLVAEENQVCAASHTEFGEQIGDMEFHGALGDVQSVRDFLVGEVLEQGGKHFLLAVAELRRRVFSHASSLRGVQDEIYEA